MAKKSDILELLDQAVAESSPMSPLKAKAAQLPEVADDLAKLYRARKNNAAVTVRHCLAVFNSKWGAEFKRPVTYSQLRRYWDSVEEAADRSGG